MDLNCNLLGRVVRGASCTEQVQQRALDQRVAALMSFADTRDSPLVEALERVSSTTESFSRSPSEANGWAT